MSTADERRQRAGPQPGAGRRRSGVAGTLALRAAAPAGAGLRRRRGVRRDRRPAVAVRGARHGAVDAPAAGLRRARPQAPRSVVPRLGRAGRAGRARAAASHRRPGCSRSCSPSTRAAAGRCWRSACAARRPVARPSGRCREPDADRLRRSSGAAQCAASCQLRPVPTETSSGTARSAAPPISRADELLERVALPRRRPRRRARRAPGAASASPARPRRSRASTWSIATLIRSAAEPWIGALSAIRSAISRRCRLSLVRSGR